MMQQLLKLAAGNPGAMTFLMQFFTGPVENAAYGISIIPKVEKCGIVGTDLYVLWSDLCGKDISKVATLCKNTPDAVLIDACSRQDYSGRDLVKQYFE